MDTTENVFLGNTTSPTPRSYHGNHQLMWTVLTVVICFVGFLGNCLCAVVFHRMRSSNRGVHLLKYLSFTDNGVLVLTALLLCQLRLSVWYVITEFVSITYILFTIIYTFEIYLTVLISIQRCVAVYLPFEFNRYITHSRLTKALVANGVLSVLFNVPTLVAYWPVDTLVSARFKQSYGFSAYTGYVIPVFRGILPMIILIVCSIILITSVQRSAVDSGASGREADRLTVFVLTITSISVITHLMSAVSLLAYIIEGGLQSVVFLYVEYISSLLISINASINVVTYCIFGKEFRRNLISIFRPRKAPLSSALVLEEGLNSDPSAKN